ncbi:MAG: helix-turn-helix domain-containing protein [Acidimicrobiia bacterium]|nr:helix-turn-helix domain-containing protein [Acidimicrobiia bacterium]
MSPTLSTPGMAPSLFVGVDEAARLLGISRSLAYELANQWIDSNEATGLPAIRLGRRLLVKRAALEQMAGIDGSGASAE